MSQEKFPESLETASQGSTTEGPSHKDFGRLLIITYESLGDKMAGPGIRAWELAKALGAHGVPVTLGTPFQTQRRGWNIEICQYAWEEPATLRRLIDRADAVMATGPVIARLVNVLGGPIEKPVIVDTYYVPEVEQIMLSLLRGELGFDPTPAFMQDLFVYLRQGDYFTCALSNQYDFWLGALMAAGRINESTLRQSYHVEHMIGIVPLGLPPEPPVRKAPQMKGVVPGIGPDDKILYWGGGIWDWTDPFTLMEALKIVNQKRSDVRAVFGALHHYEKAIVPEMRAASRLVDWIKRENWLGSKVFFLDWVNYDQRGAYLLEADLGISLAPKTLESHFAIRSRLLDHLWTGLPGVLSSGDEMASVLASIGLAKLVEPGDVSGTADAVLAYLEDPGHRGKIASALDVYRGQYAWPNAVKALVDFMHSPRRAPDSEYARSTIGYMTPLRKEWEQLRVEKSALQNELRILRNSRPVRIADAIGNFLSKIGLKL